MGGNKKILKRKQSFKNVEKSLPKETNVEENSEDSSVSKRQNKQLVQARGFYVYLFI